MPVVMEPDDWRLHYDEQELVRAYLKWERNGFTRIPRPGEDDDLPEYWLDDLLTIGTLFNFQRDNMPEV